MMSKIFFIFVVTITTTILCKAQKDTLFVYGPGGPLAPIEECAQIFGNQKNIFIKVTAGPEEQWIEKAKGNADLIYGGAEYC